MSFLSQLLKQVNPDGVHVNNYKYQRNMTKERCSWGSKFEYENFQIRGKNGKKKQSKEIFLLLVRTRRTNSHAVNIYLVHFASPNPPTPPYIYWTPLFTVLSLHSFFRGFQITHYFML